MKRILILLGIAAGIYGGCAGAFFWDKDPVNTDWRGMAVKGYDVVAYFTEGRPVEGDEQFEYRWKEARWRFASQKHLDMFKADPEKYAPRYGGY